MIFGVIFFALIITGLTLNTIFLVREIRRNEQHDAFLNAVTHELKTPIASIKLYLETLKTRDIDEARRREFYDVIEADSNRLLNTVEQVLQASRTREKDRQMNLTELDLGELLQETADVVRTRHNLDEGAIRMSIPTDRVHVLGDRDELATVFSNLLDNAVRYSPNGPRISVRLKLSGDSGEVYIMDHGLGIPRAELKRIFKRFYRANSKGTGTVKGTGLGLAIVRSVVEKHGGRVLAESNGEGKGSTFLVRLPRV